MNTHDRLKHFGYAIVPGVVPAAICEAAANRLDKLENEQKYDRAMQVVLHCLHERDSSFIPFLDWPEIYRVAQDVLNSGEQIILNSLSASRSVKVDDETWNANADAHRAHIDHRMPTPDFENTESICAIICLDDFSEENGALKIWPFTHLAKDRLPKKQSDLPPPISCVAKRGSIIYWLGQTYHAVGRNLSGARRWGLITQFTYWFCRPTFDYTKCGEDIYSKLTLRQRGLLGFNSVTPNGKSGRSYTVTPIEELA